MDSVVKSLENMLENPTNYQLMFELNSNIEKMLHELFGEKILPIDLNILGEKLGVDVYKEDLNLYKLQHTKFIQGNYISDTSFINNKKFHDVAINSASPHYANRYALAYCLGHHLLKSEYANCYEFTPINCNISEIVVENFALTLLLPLSECFRIFDEFIETRKSNIRLNPEKVFHFTVDDWIHFLSEKAILYKHYAVIRFQQIRQLCGLAELIGDSQLIEIKNKYMKLYDL